MIQTIFELKQQGEVAEAGALISWLCGSGNVAASAKKAAGIKGDIGSRDALDYLRGVLEIVKAAGYKGLSSSSTRPRPSCACASTRGTSRLTASARSPTPPARYPGLLWVFTGTPEFFDTRHGVAGLAPLHDRIRFLKQGSFASLRQAQLELTPFDAERLRSVALRLRELYPDRGPRRASSQKVSTEFIDRLVDEVTTGFKGDVGVVPRQFLREFVTQLDLVDEHDDYDPMTEYGFTPTELSAEEQHVLTGAPLGRPRRRRRRPRADGGRLVSVFARFAPRLQEAIVARLGWSSLRPVQELAGEALLDGKNAVVLAPTAGGKTEASMFPALSQAGRATSRTASARSTSRRSRRCSTTRRIGSGSTPRWSACAASSGTATRRTTTGVSSCSEPAELLMTTPESLEVMLVSQRVDERNAVRRPADRRHRRGPRARRHRPRRAPDERASSGSAASPRHDVQRVGLSATVGNPEAILDWLQGTSQRAGRRRRPAEAAERGGSSWSSTDQTSRRSPARPRARRDGAEEPVLLPVARHDRGRRRAHATGRDRRSSSTTAPCRARSASSPRSASTTARDACIVCTSTLELGIDVGDLDRVLQAEAPDTVSSFLQRMGRTGRREGQAANTTFFCETTEGVLQAIALIELAKAGWVERVDGRTTAAGRSSSTSCSRCRWRATASRADDAWEHLSRVPDFRGIHRAEFDRLVELDDARRLAAARRRAGWSSGRRRNAGSAAGTSWSSSPSSRARRPTPCRPPAASRSAR